ncbi:hypothetical protein ACM1RC_15190 [Paenibacillus azoreducens]|uniref:hypothetical protein n=1 Tax=Paenibacillus azoreducens TaxID=116718 RepID=UPI0039F621F7
MALTTGIITNTGTAPATNLVMNIDNDNLSFSSTVVYHVYVWNSVVSKSLVYANLLNINANTSQIINLNIAGNTSYEVQFLVNGQVPTDTVITVCRNGFIRKCHSLSKCVEYRTHIHCAA